MHKKIRFSARLNFWLTTVLLTAAALAQHPAAAQAPRPAPATIRLPPEDQAPMPYGGQHNFYFLPPGKTGEDSYQSAGFFGQKLRPYLGSSPEALRELDSYRRQKTLYLADRGLLLGAAAVYASQVFSANDAQYFNGVQQGAVGVAALSLLATIFINRNTGNHLRQAVDNYNASLPAAAVHSTQWQQFRPTGAGVAAVQGRPVLALDWKF